MPGRNGNICGAGAGHRGGPKRALPAGGWRQAAVLSTVGAASSRPPAATLPGPWRLKFLLGVRPPSWPSPWAPGPLPSRGPRTFCTENPTLSSTAERAARSQGPRFPQPESLPTSRGLPTVASRRPRHTASSERRTPRPLTGLRQSVASLPPPSPVCEVHALAHQPPAPQILSHLPPSLSPTCHIPETTGSSRVTSCSSGSMFTTNLTRQSEPVSRMKAPQP